jgi:hypothetical protein
MNSCLGEYKIIYILSVRCLKIKGTACFYLEALLGEEQEGNTRRYFGQAGPNKTK